MVLGFRVLGVKGLGPGLDNMHISKIKEPKTFRVLIHQHASFCRVLRAAILGHEGNHTLQQTAAENLKKKKSKRKLLPTSMIVNFLY